MTPLQMTEAEMLTHVAKAVVKMDRSGLRGATLVTVEETIALGLLAVLYGEATATGLMADQAKTTMTISAQETAT